MKQEIIDERQYVEQQAKDLWGDVPITTELLLWEDGDFEVSVFHTMSARPNGVFRVALLHHPGDFTEHLATRQTGQKEEIIWSEML